MKLLWHIPNVYLGFAFNVEEAFLRYNITGVVELVLLFWSWEKHLPRRSELIEKLRICLVEITIFAPSIPFWACQLYTSYTLSVCGSDQWLREVVHYDACRQECSALILSSKSVLQVLKMNWNSTALRDTVTQTLAYCRSVQGVVQRTIFFKVCLIPWCRGTAQSLKKDCWGEKYRLRETPASY